ncbi:MAG: hypothetical protein ACKO0Z_24980 [Betaproteobacteria bacterium]
MSEKIKLVQGDNLPYIRLNLTNADGTALDVSGGVVKVYFRAAGTTVILTTLQCQFVTDGSDGVVQFNFPGDTLNVPAGSYEGEVEVDLGGNIQTIYDILKFSVRAQFA